MSNPHHHGYSSEELDRLEREIPARYPGWVFSGVVSGGGGYALGAETAETIPDRQCALTEEALFKAIKWRQRHRASVGITTTPVAEGVIDTTT